jgi:hypothetical protein
MNKTTRKLVELIINGIEFEEQQLDHMRGLRKQYGRKIIFQLDPLRRGLYRHLLWNKKDRMGGDLYCPNCGKTFHLFRYPVKRTHSGTCGLCGSMWLIFNKYGFDFLGEMQRFEFGKR